MFFAHLSFTVYIEAVASEVFGAGSHGLINPPDPGRTYTLSTAEVAVFDEEVYHLLADLNVLIEQAKVSYCS